MNNGPDISHFEKRFQEMISEIQRTKTEFNNLEKEHLFVREQICSKESLLQSERRASQQLQARLQLAMETINHLEEEKIRHKIDHSNLLINYENVIKERNVLSKEALSSQTEAAKFKMKAENLQKTLQREIQRKAELERTLIEYKRDNERVISLININLAKISKEHKHLLESGRAIISLNKRLQSFGLCFHAINQKNREEIKDLQQKLTTMSMKRSKSLSINDKLHPEIESLCFKLREMLLEMKSKMQGSLVIEENINKIFHELTYMYNNPQCNIVNQEK